MVHVYYSRTSCHLLRNSFLFYYNIAIRNQYKYYFYQRSKEIAVRSCRISTIAFARYGAGSGGSPCACARRTEKLGSFKGV